MRAGPEGAKESLAHEQAAGSASGTQSVAEQALDTGGLMPSASSASSSEEQTEKRVRALGWGGVTGATYTNGDMLL